MREPTEIEPGAFFDFIGQPGLVLVFVPVHIAHRYNPALARHLSKDEAETVEFGRIGLIELVLGFPPAAMFLAQGLAACGVSVPLAVAPGYYLFRDGQLLAWESGFVAPADLPRMIGPSLLGLVGYAFTQNRGILLTTMRLGMREASARRLAARFREAAERPPPSAAPPPPPPPRPPRDELLAAYSVLGVAPTATDREVNRAWRKLQSELHPDLAANDPTEHARRTRLMSELNRAREVIRRHRGRRAGAGHPHASRAR